MVVPLKNKKTKPIFLFALVFIILTSSFIYGAINNTQVIDLTQKVLDYFTEVSRGNVGGQTSLFKFGFNPAIGTGMQDIWTVGGVLVFQQTATQYNISSSSGSDTIAGEGARVITIEGLDENFSEITEDVNLSGTSVSQTTQEFIRLNRAFIKEVGTYGFSNNGTISIVTSDNGNPQGGLIAKEGQTQKTHFTIPAGKTGILKRTSVSVDTTKIATVQMFQRQNANNTVSPISPIRIFHQVDGVTGQEEESYLANLRFPEKTDIWMTATLSQASGGVELDYDLILFDN